MLLSREELDKSAELHPQIAEVSQHIILSGRGP